MLIKFNFSYYKYIFYNSKLEVHRLGGPCFENKWGDLSYVRNGFLHREDGPAEQYGASCIYYLFGKKYKEKEYWGIIRFGMFA